MGRPYSMDLRERVVAAIEGGMSTGEAADQFSIGKATAGAWARLKRATGSLVPPKQGKPKGLVLDANADFILGLIEENPDVTLDEMAGASLVNAVSCLSERRCGSSSTGTTCAQKRPRMQAKRSAPT